MNRFFLLIITSFIFSQHVIAQNDTIVVYDTIYEALSPVIITKTIDNNSIDTGKIRNISFGLFYTYGQYSYSDKEVFANGNQYALGLQIKKEIKPKINLGIGVGVSKQSNRYTRRTIINHSDTTLSISQDTVGEYTQISFDEEVTHYIIENDTITNIENYDERKQEESLISPTYFRFYLSTGYKFLLKKNFIYLDALLVPAILIDEKGKLQARKQLIDSGFSIGMGRNLSKNIVASIGYQHLISLIDTYQDMPSKASSKQVKIAFSYIF